MVWRILDPFSMLALLASLFDWRTFSNLMGHGALFLIVGGLFVLGLVVLLVVLRSFFPVGTPSKGLQLDVVDDRLARTPSLAANGKPQPPVALDAESLDPGRRIARREKPKGVDDIVEAARREGLGDARFLRLLDDRTVVRFYRCNECIETKSESLGCGTNAGFLEASVARLFNVKGRVRETHCRRRGDPACDFEVQHAAA